MRARTGAGERWDDPSVDLLFELLTDLERGDESSFSVERLDGRPGVFLVKRVDGGRYALARYGEVAGHIVKALTPNKRWAHAALVDWAYAIADEAHEVHGWKEGLQWENVVETQPPRRPLGLWRRS
jgi:hypothetical protein